MMIVEFLRDKGVHYVPRNIFSFQKIQEEYSRCREIGNFSGCDNISKYN